MVRLKLLVSLLAFLGFAAPLSRSVAQENSPAASTPGAMTAEQTRAVLEPYLAALVAREDIAPFFSDDVVLSLVEVGQEIRGRDAVAGAIDALHRQTFDASPEVVNLVVDEGTAAGEFVFVGVHTGEFADIPATGREVKVPYKVFYDLAEDQITALRIHGFASGLAAQLTAEEGSTATPTSGA
jgi:predicted ester cyclase